MVRFFTSSTKLQLRPTNYPVQNGDCDPNLESVELQLFSATASNASAVSKQKNYNFLLNNEAIANLDDTGKQKVAFLITLISVATRDEHKNNSRFPINIDRVTAYLIDIVQIKDHAVAKEIAQALLGAVQIEESLTHANLTNFLRISLDMVVVQPCDVEHALTIYCNCLFPFES
jgi:hypothetical protein